MIVAVFVATFVVVGVIDGLMGTIDEPYSPVTAPATLFVMFLSFVWCKADVEENGFTMPIASRMLCGLVPPIGFVLHLYHTRPLWQAILAFLKGIGVLVVALIGYAVAALTVEALAA